MALIDLPCENPWRLIWRVMLDKNSIVSQVFGLNIKLFDQFAHRSLTSHVFGTRCIALVNAPCLWAGASWIKTYILVHTYLVCLQWDLMARGRRRLVNLVPRLSLLFLPCRCWGERKGGKGERAGIEVEDSWNFRVWIIQQNLMSHPVKKSEKIAQRLVSASSEMKFRPSLIYPVFLTDNLWHVILWRWKKLQRYRYCFDYFGKDLGLVLFWRKIKESAVSWRIFLTLSKQESLQLLADCHCRLLQSLLRSVP